MREDFYSLTESGLQTIFLPMPTTKKLLISGEDLVQKGFCVTMQKKRSAKIYFYKKC